MDINLPDNNVQGFTPGAIQEINNEVKAFGVRVCDEAKRLEAARRQGNNIEVTGDMVRLASAYTQARPARQKALPILFTAFLTLIGSLLITYGSAIYDNDAIKSNPKIIFTIVVCWIAGFVIILFATLYEKLGNRA